MLRCIKSINLFSHQPLNRCSALPLILISCNGCVGVIDAAMLGDDVVRDGRNSSFDLRLLWGTEISALVWFIVLWQLQLILQKPTVNDDEFKDFDEVDDARSAIDENESKPVGYITRMLQKSELSEPSRDLLRRLLEPSPQHRLKSLLALQRIAFFHNYNFDDIRHMKVSATIIPSFDYPNKSSSIVEQLHSQLASRWEPT